MGINGLFQSNEKKYVQMLQNDLISFKGKEVLIICLDGLLWVTYANGTEYMITKDQSFIVSSTGTTCIHAFQESTLQIESRKRVRIHYVHAKAGLFSLPSPAFS